MKITSPTTAFKDDRGSIIDILEQTNFNYATLIKSRAGAERGNHYHKNTTQYTYVLSGLLRVLSQAPGQPVESAVVGRGDLLLNEPYESHAQIALEDSEFLVLTSGERGGKNYENDTYRLPIPLSQLILK